VRVDDGSGERAITRRRLTLWSLLLRETLRVMVKFNFRPAGMNLRVFQVAVGLACTLLFLAIAFYRVQWEP